MECFIDGGELGNLLREFDTASDINIGRLFKTISQKFEKAMVPCQ